MCKQVTCKRCIKRGILHPPDKHEMVGAGIVRYEYKDGLANFADSVSGYMQNVDVIIEEEEREARSRRKEIRRRSTHIDGRESKLNGAMQLELHETTEPMMITHYPVNKRAS